MSPGDVEFSHSSLPVVDISGGHGADRRIARDIGEAAREVGFFFVTGHGIPGALIEEVFADSARFFALPTDEKQRQSIRLESRRLGLCRSDLATDPAVRPGTITGARLAFWARRC